MSDISPISSPRQRDAWLSILALLLLNILTALVFLDVLVRIFPSLSSITLTYCALILVHLLPIIYLSRRYGTISVSDFHLRGLDFVVLFVSFILLTIVTSIISLKGPYKPYTFSGQEIFKLHGIDYFIALLSIFFIFPSLEETLFRRYVFEIFRNKYKILLAILLTALTDTGLHITVGSVTGLVLIFFWQLFFTFIYFKSRLGVSIVIHCLTDIFLYYF